MFALPIKVRNPLWINLLQGSAVSINSRNNIVRNNGGIALNCSPSKLNKLSFFCFMILGINKFTANCSASFASLACSLNSWKALTKSGFDLSHGLITLCRKLFLGIDSSKFELSSTHGIFISAAY